MTFRMHHLLSILLLVGSSLVVAMSPREIQNKTNQIRKQINDLRKMEKDGSIITNKGQQAIEGVQALIDKIKPYNIQVAFELEQELGTISQQRALRTVASANNYFMETMDLVLGEITKRPDQNPDQTYRDLFNEFSKNNDQIYIDLGLDSGLPLFPALQKFKRSVSQILGVSGDSLLSDINKAITGLRAEMDNLKEKHQDSEKEKDLLVKENKDKDTFIAYFTRFLGEKPENPWKSFSTGNQTLARFNNTLKSLTSNEQNFITTDISDEKSTLLEIANKVSSVAAEVKTDVQSINTYIGANILKETTQFYDNFNDAVKKVYDLVGIGQPFVQGNSQTLVVRTDSLAVGQQHASLSADMQKVAEYIKELNIKIKPLPTPTPATGTGASDDATKLAEIINKIKTFRGQIIDDLNKGRPDYLEDPGKQGTEKAWWAFHPTSFNSKPAQAALTHLVSFLYEISPLIGNEEIVIKESGEKSRAVLE